MKENSRLEASSDPHFHNSKGQPLIASEVKTTRSFLDGEDGRECRTSQGSFQGQEGRERRRNQRWYEGTRGTQVLSTLYAFNCPTFLLNQTHWKLFVENSERNATLTFPHGPTTAEDSFFGPSRLVHPMDKTFIKAIVICLLSDRDALEREMMEVAEARATETAARQSSSTQAPNLPSSQGSSYWPASSETIPQSQGPGTERVSSNILEPTFVSGYDGEHKPIYLPVRVFAQDEEEIMEHEKMEALVGESSTMTLAE